MENKEITTLEQKQAFWAEQLPNFEAKYWLPSHFQFLAFDMEQGNYVIKDDLDPIFEDDATEIWHRVNTGWAMWKKAIKFTKQQATPEGFVLVPKDQITCFWQDNDEPENFCNTPSDFDNLGDCIDLGDIMQINKHTQANIGTEKLYGTWVADAGNPLERSRSKFFVGTENECEEIVLENERVFEEAQEQSHD
ncbi:hypothetical protein KTI63_03380 [Acinetobacter guillouiae]|uniref:hypothetical protein n=1 Tax=Acinetobacter guillouiae TaxID=106649 RepID=UPI0021CFA236|nr:hypothetical protein [Acinetobacter guillouiae]MCU4491508.1 hypothetical protein [Acinetobacter guillouiae]